MPNAATISVIIKTKDAIKQMIQHSNMNLIASKMLQIFLNASGSYRQDFNVGDFVQFTRRLVYENETLYITLINTPADNALPLSTPTITIATVLAKLYKVRFFQFTYHEYNAVTNSKQVERTVNILVREEDTRLVNATNKLTSDLPFLTCISDDFIEIFLSNISSCGNVTDLCLGALTSIEERSPFSEEFVIL